MTILAQVTARLHRDLLALGSDRAMASSSSFRQYAWEGEEYGWEKDSNVSGEPGDEGPLPDGEEAGGLLAQYLYNLLLEGKISARAVCTIAFWAQRAGAKGKIQEYSYKPESPSGHFMRHIDLVNGVKLKDLRTTMLHIKMPGLEKYDCSRQCHKVPIMPPMRV